MAIFAAVALFRVLRQYYPKVEADGLSGQGNFRSIRWQALQTFPEAFGELVVFFSVVTASNQRGMFATVSYEY